MAVLLDLRCQRTSAWRVAHAAAHEGSHRERLGEAVPFDGRVAAGRAGLEQLTVLDEQERVDDSRRNGREFREDPLRMA
jgi:hypothetical protein